MWRQAYFQSTIIIIFYRHIKIELFHNVYVKLRFYIRNFRNGMRKSMATIHSKKKKKSVSSIFLHFVRHSIANFIVELTWTILRHEDKCIRIRFMSSMKWCQWYTEGKKHRNSPQNLVCWRYLPVARVKTAEYCTQTHLQHFIG